MKNLFKTSLAMVLALLLIASCSKKNDEVKPDDQKEKAITLAEMQNKANPHDGQGEMYNVFLMAISGYSGDIGGWDVGQLAENNGDIGGWDVGQLAAFNGDIGDWDVGQLAENNGDIGGWDVGQFQIAAMDFYGANDKDSGVVAQQRLSKQIEALSGMNISDHNDCWYHPDWCKDVINPVEIFNSSNGGTLHNRTIKYINAVRAQEANLLKNDKINKAEKDGLLICYSIARHAAGYWYNETRNHKPNGKFSLNIIHLSTLAASTAFVETDTKDVGVVAAILSAYIAITQLD